MGAIDREYWRRVDRSHHFKVLYRVGDEETFEWLSLDGEFDPEEAYAKVNLLKLNGLVAIVCTSSEYLEVGIPETYDAKEYYSLGPFRH